MISKAPLSDHCYIDLKLGARVENNRRKGYWKFNATLLENEDYCNMVREIIRVIENDNSFADINKWEFLKFKIRTATISFSKKLNRVRKEKEQNIFQEISRCCNSPDPNSQELMELQTRLDNMYLQRAQGAFVRSRAKWIEAGEKNSYFGNLERS